MKYDYGKLKSITFEESRIDGSHGVHLELDGQCLKITERVIDETTEEVQIGEVGVLAFISGFESVGMEHWEKYIEAPTDMSKMQFYSWMVAVKFTDGKLFIKEGKNAFPENWDLFLSILSRYCNLETKTLNKFTFELNSVEKIKVSKEISKIIGKEATMNYYEKIDVDRATGTYTSIRGMSEESNATLTIKGSEAVETLLEDIADITSPASTKRLSQPKNFKCDYTLDLEYADGEKKHFQGGYNRVELPGNWEDIVDCFRAFEDQMSGTMALNKRNFLKGLLKDEFIYLSVAFDEYSDQTYYYRTTDDNIVPGDTVIVPVGKNNKESVAYVVRKEIYKQKDVPLPLDKTKEVIRVE